MSCVQQMDFGIRDVAVVDGTVMKSSFHTGDRATRLRQHTQAIAPLMVR